MNELGRITNYGILVEGGRVDRDNDIQLDPQTYVGNGKGVYDNPFFHDSEEAGTTFGLRSLEFGKWLSENDMANFLYASSMGLHQLARIFNLKNAEEIGFNGRLSLTLGARGQGGGAAAHFEALPYSVINITKPHWSVGSLAHEYGHAFDNILSYHIGGRKQSFVSGGRSTRKSYDSSIAKNGNWFEQQFEKLFNALYWNKNGSKTEFLINLESETEYYQRRTEVWARTTEVYVWLKLQELDDKNNFLVGSPVGAGYPYIDQIKPLMPFIEKIFSKGFSALRRKKADNSLKGISSVLGYMGFRKTLKSAANLNDTLKNMKRIALRDSWQVADLARELEGDSVEDTASNIWHYIRENITYKLDQDGVEELRSPARTLHDKVGDCDDYTILASAIMLELDIDHIYKVAAYEEKGKFQHIYPVAMDEVGEEYVIDVVPEIPHFNYEAKPIIDLKIVTMELQELSGLGAAHLVDAENDFANELNQPFSLSGFPEIDDDDTLEDEFLSGLGEVDTEEEADIVLSGADDMAELIERGFLAEINKAKLSLMKELKSPSVISQTVNVGAEIETLNDLMEAWDDAEERDAILSEAIGSNSAYANFYKGIQIGLDKTEELAEEGLDGFDDDEPIYLARVSSGDVELSELYEDELDGLGLFRRRKSGSRPKRGKGRLKKFVKKLGDSKVGKVVKKVARAVVKYNPATITIRAGVLIIMKTNLARRASKLIYGYLSQEEAQKQGLDISEWKKIKDGLAKLEKAYHLIGGEKEKLKKAIITGRARKKTGVRISGLGVAPAAAAAPAGTAAAAGAGWLAKVGNWMKNIDFKKLFKGVKAGTQVAKEAKELISSQQQGGSDDMALAPDGSPMPPNVSRASNFSVTDPLVDEPMQLDENGNPVPQTGFVNKVKSLFQKHKKAIIITGVFGIVGLVGIIIWKKMAKKKKNQLRGAKAARTRKRNQRLVLAGVPKSRTTRRRTQKKSSSTVGKLPVLRRNRKSSTRSHTKASNANRLKKMHKIAKQLQKSKPRAKYSTLLKEAAKKV